MDQQNRTDLLAALHKCADECNHCATACLQEQDVKMLAKCISLDIDCAQICNVAASLLARGSKHAQHLLKECVEICTACADECAKHAENGMEHCRNCAEACRACAEACSKN